MQEAGLRRSTDTREYDLAELLIKRGQLYVLIGLYNKAKNDYDRAYAYATERDMPRARTKALLEIANVAYLEGQLHTSLKFLKRASPLIEALHNHELTFSFWRYKGNTCRIQGDFDAALACYRRLLRYKGPKSRYSKAVALNLIGLAYQGARRYAKAVANIRQAYQILKDTKNYTAQGSCLANIGYVYTFSGKAEKALPCFEKAAALLYELKAKSLIAGPLLNWGSALYNLGQYDDALEKWQEALVTNEELGDSSVVAMLHNNIGYALIRKKRYQESVKHFQISLAMKKELGLEGYLPSTYNGFAEAHYNLFMQTMKKIHRVKALQYANAAKKTARMYRNKHDDQIAQELIKQLHRSKK